MKRPPRSLRSPPRGAINIEDLQRLAARRLPRVVLDYLEGGAEDHHSLRANRRVFEQIQFKPRTLVDVSRRSQTREVFGQRFDAPIGIAPTGAAGLFWHDAEIELARAARRANIPFVLSTHSFVTYERVVCNAGHAPWFQLYMSQERNQLSMLLQRLRHAGCEVLVLTTDVPVGGNREYNERNGFGMPFRLSARNTVDGLLHPRWMTSVFLRSWRTFRRIDPDVWNMRRDALDWRDLAWLRDAWQGRLLVKGILCAEDAQHAARLGVDGVIVSNHGGRQLDGAPATIDVLPEIAAAVGKETQVMIDGGFRRGADVVKALALGADLVFIGRPALYGVSVAGSAGALRAIEILRGELDRVQALLGCPSLAELGPQFLRLPTEPAGVAAGRIAHAAAALRLA